MQSMFAPTRPNHFIFLACTNYFLPLLPKPTILLCLHVHIVHPLTGIVLARSHIAPYLASPNHFIFLARRKLYFICLCAPQPFHFVCSPITMFVSLHAQTSLFPCATKPCHFPCAPKQVYIFTRPNLAPPRPNHYFICLCALNLVHFLFSPKPNYVIPACPDQFVSLRAQTNNLFTSARPNHSISHARPKPIYLFPVCANEIF